MFKEHRSSPAQDLYSVGHLLSQIAKKMEVPDPLGMIALEFLKANPEERIPLSAGLERLAQLTGPGTH